MSHLTYIPSKHELQMLNKRLSEVTVRQEEPVDEVSECRAVLSQSDLQSLLKRLVPTVRPVNKQQIQQLAKANKLTANKLRSSRQIQNRLIEEGKQRELRREKMMKEKQRQISVQLQDRPKISKNIQVIQKPISQRLNQIEKQRQYQRLRLESEMKPTFVPEINQQSKFIAEIRNNDVNVVERLMKEPLKLQEKHNKLIQAINEQMSKKSTFVPEINKNTNKLLMNNPLFQVPFTKRTEIINSRRKHESAITTEPQCTFQPRICTKSQLLVDNNGDVGQRLYINALKINEKKKLMKQVEAKRYSFKPKINKYAMKSEKVDSEDSFIDSDDESLFNQENLHTYENSDKKARRSLSQKNTAIKSRYMEESRKQASQMTSDERESQRCSFKPSLFKPVRSTTTAEIYGLENFLSNVDRARKLQLDKKYQNQKVSSSKYL